MAKNKKTSRQRPSFFSKIRSFLKKKKRTIRWTFILFFVVLLTPRIINPPITSIIIARKIQSLFTGHPRKTEWTWISSKDIPKHVKQAAIAAEDARFMEHLGLDLLSMKKAWGNRNSSQRLRGASTITMQTIKNLYLWPGRSYLRKGIEIIIAPFANLLWGKRRTLELYLNIVEFGDGIYGIEAAAQHYYKKSAKSLSPYEAVSLVAILPNPHAFSPFTIPPSMRRHFNRIVTQMKMADIPS